jgi:hypothetical protein
VADWVHWGRYSKETFIYGRFNKGWARGETREGIMTRMRVKHDLEVREGERTRKRVCLCQCL